jgi:hypothetical protein
MAFREKTAWISLFVGLGVYIFYFVQAVPAIARGDAGGGYYFRLMVVATVISIIATIVLTVASAVMAPRDAKAPRDEREKLISLKASQFARFTLSAGAFAAIIALFVGVDRFLAANLLFFTLALSELMQSGAWIFYNRRGV